MNHEPSTREQQPSPTHTAPAQQPFQRARPFLAASAALGIGAGFLLASVLSISQGLRLPLGLWWVALVQAHGHAQLFGWAGLFVLGVALHFLPRLRGTPLAAPGAVGWSLGLLAGGLALCAISQPLLALGWGGTLPWQVLWGAAALAQICGATGVVGILLLTLRRGPPLARRPALQAVLPPLLCALCACWLALVLNAAGVAGALLSQQVLVSPRLDALSVALGLYGFLVPVALGMAVRLLPLYLGLRPFPPQAFQAIFWCYLAGLLLRLLAAGFGQGTALSTRLDAAGAALLGGALLAFLLLQGLLLTRRRRQLQVAAVHTDRVQLPARPYPVALGNNPALYGPFARLLQSAFAWLALAAALLLANGVLQLLGLSAFAPDDLIRHALTVGFIALLIFGVGQRMLPGFAGQPLRSPRLVAATLWLGNAAVLLRVVPGLLGLLLGGLALPPAVPALLGIAFACSGPLGWLALCCFTYNLWRILRPA
ncbi:MAG TPA: NnrS family protein [Ktedonobacterales bacterium]